jgi:hypothetical protein
LDCSSAPALANAAGTVVTCIIAPPIDWRLYLTPLLVLISSAIAWAALRNARLVARQKATLDLIEKRESTAHYRVLHDSFYALRTTKGFGSLTQRSVATERQRQSLIDYLNHYELVALGIRQGILDERFYRAWMEGAYVRDWNAAADWVQRERWKQNTDGSWRYRSSIFEHYQHMACRWSKEAKRLTQASSPPPDHASGPGDVALPEPVDDVVLKN